MRRFLFTLCAAFLISPVGLFGSTAHAETAPMNCTFENDFARLDKVKSNPSADYLANVRAELAVRKDILRKIVACGAEEVKLLKAKVAGASTTDSGAQDIKKQLTARLDEALERYATSESRIDTLGLRGSQELSRSLKDWRMTNYSQLSELALNFLVWEKNKSLFKTARIRFEEIGKAVNSLKFADTEDIRKLFDEAKTDLEHAESLHRDVEQKLKTLDSPESTFAIIKESLEALSKTYQNFFDLSQMVQKVVPR